MAAESVFIYPGGREVPKGTTGPRPRQSGPPQSPSSGMMNSSLGLAPPRSGGGGGGGSSSRPGMGESYEAEMGAGEPSQLLPVSAGQVRPPQTAEAVRRAREGEARARAAVASPGAAMTAGDVQSVLRANKDKLGALQALANLNVGENNAEAIDEFLVKFSKAQVWVLGCGLSLGF